MNDLPTKPDPAAQPERAADQPALLTASPAAGAASPSAAAGAPSVTDSLQRPLTIAVVVLGILLAAQTWSSHNQMRNLREEMARRLQKGDIVNTETGALARSVQETAKELQIKVGLLESRQTEAQSQQLALEQLYQDLSKNRDEWALALSLIHI